MNKIYKSYKIRLEIISPIHIGSGDEYIPTDYVIKNNKMQIINRDKFIEKIEKENKYDEFLRICDTGDILKIRKFIFDNYDDSMLTSSIQVSEKIQRDYYDKLYKPSQLEGKERKKVINALEIRKFVYDNFYNKPIIPGSSIKGAIRTAVLDHYAKEKPKKFDVLKNKKYANQNLQKYLLEIKQKDNSDDPFRLIKISDFKIIEGCSIIDYVYNISKFGDNKKKVPVKMELLKPETLLEGDILINKVHKDSKFTMEKISEWCNQHYLEDTYNFESDYFNYSKSNMPTLNKEPYTFYLKIGQHSGAFAVTLNTYRNENIWHQKLRKNMNHQTTTWTSESFNMPLGWVKCKILNPDFKNEMKISKNKQKLASDEDIKKLEAFFRRA